MLTKEEEKQFCERRDEMKYRLNYLKTTLPEANGRSDEIRIEISSLETKLSREYDNFIKESGALLMAMNKAKKFSFRHRSSVNVETKDYDSLFSDALNVLFRCVEKYDYKKAEFSTLFTLAMRRIFLNKLRDSSKRKKYSLQEEDYSNILEDKSQPNSLFELQRREELDRLSKGLRILTDKEIEFLIRRYRFRDSEYCKTRYNMGRHALAKLKAYFESFENRSAA